MPWNGESPKNHQTSQLAFFSMTFSIQDFQINIQTMTAMCPFKQTPGVYKTNKAS